MGHETPIGKLDYETEIRSTYTTYVNITGALRKGPTAAFEAPLAIKIKKDSFQKTMKVHQSTFRFIAQEEGMRIGISELFLQRFNFTLYFKVFSLKITN